MSWRGFTERALKALILPASLATAASCYRAEVDLSPLLDEPAQPGGGGLTSGAGGEAAAEMGGAEPGAAGGAAGAPACEMTPEDPQQYQCRLRRPSAAVCDEQDSPGWSGCYNGGCSICTEVLSDYPYYFARHPCCSPNDTCSVHKPLKCSPLCPPPSELDRVKPCFDLEL